MRYKKLLIVGRSMFLETIIDQVIENNQTNIGEIVLYQTGLDAATKKEVQQELMNKVHDKAYALNFMITDDKKKAFGGSDYVVISFCEKNHPKDINQYEPLIDSKVSSREAYIVSNHFKAMNLIPKIIDVLHDVDTYAEDAWVINLSTPNGVINESIYRYCEHEKYIGIGQSPLKMKEQFIKQMAVQPKQLIPVVAGLDGLSYVLNLYNSKNDILPKLIDELHETKQLNDWRFEFVKQLGVYPSIHHQFFEQFMSNTEVIDTDMLAQDQHYMAKSVTDFISSVEQDKRDYQVVITSNKGHITDLPRNASIEITARITKDGPKPVHVGSLPIQIRGLVQSVKAYEELLSDAVFEKNIDKARLALQIHPAIKNMKNAKMVFDEIVSNNQYYFQGFLPKEKNNNETVLL